MLTADLHYHLPPDLIATHPAHPRDTAKLMVIDRQADRVLHRRVCDLPRLIGDTDQLPSAPRPGDLLVFNRTRVLPASFTGRRVATGGGVTGLYLESRRDPDACLWQVMLESRGKPQENERIALDSNSHLVLENRLGNGQWLARLESPEDTLALLDRIGSPPLPPYIRRQRRAQNQPEVQPEDKQSYNTVYAAQPGSVAAPTAGLHFTPQLLSQLEDAGLKKAFLTLHVGLGTFAPVRTDRVEDHPIHEEWVSIPASTIQSLRDARTAGRRVIPVGTTTVRALESLPDPLPAQGDFTTKTKLFIQPGFKFRFTDALMTNFHLPQSTLLALVAAMPGVGLDRIKNWYQQAIDQSYRFYSYGDAMLIL